MASSNAEIVSSFIESAPPGELADVVADIKALTPDDPDLVQSLAPAFSRHNEKQLMTVKLPGGSQEVIVSSHNSLGDGRYYDVESQSSFAFDQITQKASDSQTYVLESQHADLVKSLVKQLSTHAREHYREASYGAYPTEDDSSIAILLVANKYSPQNFWNGRWRSQYIFSPSKSSLTGSINVDVHYYEDGNVRLLTSKPVSTTVSSSPSANELIKQISTTEKKYQDELNRGFSSLSEGIFRGLRRQLPVTRQKIEWEKISSYRVGQDISGGRTR